MATWFSKVLGTSNGKGQHYLSYDQLLMIMYLKISISDFLTVFSARCKSFFIERRPGYALGSAALFATTTSTIIAVHATVPDATYNMEPISGKAAFYVWIYNIIWFLIQDFAKIFAYWAFAQVSHDDVDKEEERLRSMRARRALVSGNADAQQRINLRASGALGGGGLRGSFLNVSAAAAGRAGGSLAAKTMAGMEAVLESAHQRIRTLEANQAEMSRQIA